MGELIGEDILKHMQTQRDTAVNDLTSAFRNEQGPLTYSILEAVNLLGFQMVSLPAGGPIVFQNASWQAVRYQLNVLDTFLSRGLNAVTQFNEGQVLEVVRSDKMMRYLIDVVQIGYLEDVISVQRAFPAARVIYEGGHYHDMDDPDFASAVAGLDFSIDRNWNIWQRQAMSSHEKAKLEGLWSQSFQHSYGFSLEELDTTSAFFAEQTKAHRDDLITKDLHIPQGIAANQLVLSLIRSLVGQNLPQTTLIWAEADLVNGLSEVVGGTSKAEAWIERLTYQPSTRDFFTHPLIKVASSEGAVGYAPLFWLFHPAPLVMETWFGRLLREHPKSKVSKSQSQVYGGLFEDYVRDQLIAADVQKGSIYSNKVIRASDWGTEIDPYLVRLNKKEQFEVDHIVDLGETVLAISCKASDFGFDFKFAQSGFFMAYDLVRTVIETDLCYASEIETEADCLNNVNKLRKSLAIESKVVRPVLVTSRQSPISLVAVRSYLSKCKPLPSTAVVTIGDVPKMLSYLRLHPHGQFWSA